MEPAGSSGFLRVPQGSCLLLQLWEAPPPLASPVCTNRPACRGAAIETFTGRVLKNANSQCSSYLTHFTVLPRLVRVVRQ